MVMMKCGERNGGDSRVESRPIRVGKVGIFASAR